MTSAQSFAGVVDAMPSLSQPLFCTRAVPLSPTGKADAMLIGCSKLPDKVNYPNPAL